MSTTFGILKRGLDITKIVDENGEVYPYIDTDYCFTDVFHRGFVSEWLKELATHLPDETKVYPLNNSPQGIYTIGDCKKALEEEKNKEL